MITRVAGDIGTAKRELSRMLNVAMERPDVREFALSITPAYGKDQISAVYNYVQRAIEYQPDPAYNELFIAPHRMVEMIKAGKAYGDCDDIGLFCTAMYLVLGYESRIVILDQTGKWNHAASEVYSEKNSFWEFIDPTRLDRPIGWSPEYYRRTEVSL